MADPSYCKRCELWKEKFKRKMPQGMVFALIIVVVFVILNGGDLIPGRMDETTSYGLVQRFKNTAGERITEEQEKLLKPRLERLEHWWKIDPTQKLVLDHHQLRKLDILPEKEVDALNLSKVQEMLAGFAKTANENDFIGYFAIIVFFAIGVLPQTDACAILGFLFVTPFLPRGHVETTGGRHDDGGSTWFGLRRMDLIFLILLRELIIFFIPWLSIRFRNKQATDTLLVKLRRTFISTRFKIDMGFATLFYTLIVVTLTKVVPAGWLGIPTSNVFNQTAWSKALENECRHEYTPSLATWLWILYLTLTVFQLVEILVIRIGRPNPKYWQKTQYLNDDGKIDWKDERRPSRELIFERVSGFPFWYWWLVLYYCPYDDAALPMLLECGRICIKEFFRAHDADDKLYSSLLQLVEVIHFAVTVYYRCEYPLILWFPRIPYLLYKVVVAVRYEMKRWNNLLHTSKNAKVEKVDIYIPVKENDPDRVPADDLPGDFNRDGSWKKITDVSVKYDVAATKVKLPGAMREIGRLEDTNGVIFVDDFATKTEMNVNNLVWKKIRKNKWDDIENVQRGNEKVCGNKFYWDEAYRQFKVQELAKKFNKAVQRTPVGEFANRDRIMISPTAIMVFKKGYSDNNDLFYQTNNSMRAIEPSIPGGEEGKFQKWDGNNNFVEHLYRTDNTPHTFTHFTWHETNGREMVTDIQGISASKFQRKYLLTDPALLTYSTDKEKEEKKQEENETLRQLHETWETDKSDTNLKELNDWIHKMKKNKSLLDYGLEGMVNFHKSHHCGRDCHALGLDENPLESQPEVWKAVRCKFLDENEKKEFQEKQINEELENFQDQFRNLLILFICLTIIKLSPASYEIPTWY